MSTFHYHRLVNHILNITKNDGSRREISALRSGASLSTEYRAYPYVLHYLQEPSGIQRTVALRCAALIAEFPELCGVNPASSQGSSNEECKPLSKFGSWANHLAYATGESSQDLNGMVSSRLEYLHTQDVEEAITTVRRILNYAKSHGFQEQFDCINLIEVFWYWGKGHDDSSLSRRLQILRDYYGSQILSTPEGTE